MFGYFLQGNEGFWVDVVKVSLVGFWWVRTQQMEKWVMWWCHCWVGLKGRKETVCISSCWKMSQDQAKDQSLVGTSGIFTAKREVG